MFQSFEVTATPDQGPPRIASLRRELSERGLDGFLVPRADAHQGEYVAPHDERLAWLTGFTGSAGFAVALSDRAALFVDGRYRVQARAQTDADTFEIVNWPETKLGPWLAKAAGDGARIGYDPWLHTRSEIEAAEKALAGSGVSLVSSENAVDAIWDDQPAPPVGKAVAHPIELSGERSPDKIARIAALIEADGQTAAVLTLPDSISWLLNIRGSDIPRNPVVHAFAIVHAGGRVSLFLAPEKVADLGPDPLIDVAPPEAFAPAIARLTGPVRVDKATAPVAIEQILGEAGVEIAWADDPCILPKARKNPTELAATAEAHLRDGAAMAEFLAWLDREASKGALSEIDVVRRLEDCRRDTGALRDLAFETICGSGPNGAIVHYRVTEASNRRIRAGDLLLVDSGAQYADGTTDVTRTVAVGAPSVEQRTCFTRVLKGMIAISRARWPRGLAGRDLDALARFSLWTVGMDYDHGTGHGVGAYLSVHEGPQRLSRVSEVPLEPGMILSNEPGYYREGAFGIRIENLVAVREAERLVDDRDQLCFETLTWVPIDRRLIDTAFLSPEERSWINRYHAEVRTRIRPRVGRDAARWLDEVTRPI